MEIIYNLHQLPPIDTITIGFFDGCHKGHQSLLSFLSSFSGCKGIITFDTHPKQVLVETEKPILITKNQERLSLLQQFNIDYLCVLPFTKFFANQSAKEFLQSLYTMISPSTLVLGHDSKFGKDKMSVSNSLSYIANQLGIRIIQYPPYTIDNEIVSSQKIRTYLKTGNLAKANAFLGYPYSFQGIVNQGLGIGCGLGVRTINLYQQDNLLPLGVYACEIHTSNTKYQGVMNLGFAPTVNRQQLCVEAHLFHYSGNLYNQTVVITPKKFIRKEILFASKQELKHAILNDIHLAKQYFCSLELTSV